MSTTSIRVDSQAIPDSGLALGNRVLESIGRQEGLRSLLAFSDLHTQIRTRLESPESSADSDLLQTERFVRDEVLQLLCHRAQALTQADCILVAVAEGDKIVCRATAGPVPVPLGIALPESPFLRECLASGSLLRCDDAGTDSRVVSDLSCVMGARSTVLVPLRGQKESVGVLQALSLAPWSFTDQDGRCLDLFAELVLAALKPEDQDRRFHWLAGLAGEVLHPAQTNIADNTLFVEPAPAPSAAPPVEAPPAPLSTQEAIDVAVVETGLAPSLANLPPSPAQTTNDPPPVQMAPEPSGNDFTEPITIPAATIELPDVEAALPPADFISLHLEEPSFTPSDLTALEEKEDEAIAALAAQAAPARKARVLPFPMMVALPRTARPGLSVVLGLVAVAALFSAGVWWGMQSHGKLASASAIPAQKSVTTPGVPSPEFLADNLMAPPQTSSGDAPLTALPPDRLAALPKITGVRHWSSSMGSTVVIDMEDQVPYEVHRLMSPERIYFDLHDTVLTSDLEGKSMDVGDPSLTRVRVAQPVAGVTRIVLDTKDGSNFSVSMESNPYRLVVELRDNSKLASGSRTVHAITPAAPTVQPTPAPAIAASVNTPPIPARTGKFRVVLDPGHGGWDLGTVGRQGLLEKDLVLDVTRRLGKLLQTRLGSDVVFTRTGDDYLALDQRADFANQAQADLFVSVHANYSRLETARGIETYYTNHFSAPGLREPGLKIAGTTFDGSAHPTPVSLSASELREKTDASRHLAASVQRALYATLAAKSPDIRDRGIKDASFAVLTGTTMPAILTEISFVSSPADEQNLQSETYRQQIAEALYKGIARYQESAPRAKVAQLRAGAAGR